MTKSNGHINGFRHLPGEYDCLEKIFDLGIKYEEKESDDCTENPLGGETCAEPLLAMYISVTRFDDGRKIGTLHYGLTRSKWNNCLASTTQDQEKLLANARNSIIEDLRYLQKGQKPQALTEPTMV
jgi:hypothetical protein